MTYAGVTGFVVRQSQPRPEASARIETPLGTVSVAATGTGICLLEFSDGSSPEGKQTTHGMTGSAQARRLLGRLSEELAAYFAGELRRFTLPVEVWGTDFQLRAWSELVRIPYGKSISYQEQAERMGRPRAMRAAGRANGANRVAILVPCHRVIGKDGSLTGFGGGLWRKEALLNLERSGQMPEIQKTVKD